PTWIMPAPRRSSVPDWFTTFRAFATACARSSAGDCIPGDTRLRLAATAPAVSAQALDVPVKLRFQSPPAANWLGAQRSGLGELKIGSAGACEEWPSHGSSPRAAGTVKTSLSAATP